MTWIGFRSGTIVNKRYLGRPVPPPSDESSRPFEPIDTRWVWKYLDNKPRMWQSRRTLKEQVIPKSFQLRIIKIRHRALEKFPLEHPISEIPRRYCPGSAPHATGTNDLFTSEHFYLPRRNEKCCVRGARSERAPPRPATTIRLGELLQADSSSGAPFTPGRL